MNTDAQTGPAVDANPEREPTISFAQFHDDAKDGVVAVDGQLGSDTKKSEHETVPRAATESTVINAIRRICPPHIGHSSGKTS